MADLSTDLSNLTISPTATPKALKSRPAPIADSWEDDASSDSSTETTLPTTSPDDDGTQPPPPTPTTPTTHSRKSSTTSSSGVGSTTHSRTSSVGERERPATTDAVARRMISAALGVRAPRSTKEQREFDKAVREKEGKKRREEAERRREQERKEEEARRSVWED